MAYLNPAAGQAREALVRAADVGALTAASGTADGTVADVGASFVQATLNNNFQDLATKVNLIRTNMRAAGLMA
jgi:hypothetical protein